MRTKNNGRSVTLWLPEDMDQKIDRILTHRVSEAAQAGQVRRLPSRHGWILDAVRAALDSAQTGAGR